ncbi:caspase-1-A-like isoform 1-T2 [Pholidichthys leucotaenia]
MADKELIRVRSKFVDKVSRSVLIQLLDDLLGDVLNDGEKDSIMEENNSRADKARKLIDVIKKKGAKASEKMICHLQNRDSTLFEELGLTLGLSAQAAPPPQAALPLQVAPSPQSATDSQDEWSTTLIHTTEEFWKKTQSDTSVYRVQKDSHKNRVALLITNITFTDEKFNRRGAEIDEKNMDELLSALGYEVVKYTNLTAEKMNEALVKFSEHPKLEATDSVLVVIMSHGKLGAVLGVDSKHDKSDDGKKDEFPIDNIYKQLGPKTCRALQNKPKVIIIQACRGEEEGAVLLRDSMNPAVPPPPLPKEILDDDGFRTVHKEKDFISLLSSTPDTVSYRKRDEGSIMIQYLVQVFKTHAHKDDIEELFRKVMRCFEDFSISNKRQMPTKDRCTLIRRFYLYPGL